MKLNRMWLLFAILSAVFAAATAILAKVGIESVDSNLATAIRTIVVVIMAWVVVIVSHRLGHQSETLLETIHNIPARSWLFLILSGFATGASWLCYFYAIKVGDVSKVVPIDKSSLHYLRCHISRRVPHLENRHRLHTAPRRQPHNGSVVRTWLSVGRFSDNCPA